MQAPPTLAGATSTGINEADNPGAESADTASAAARRAEYSEVEVKAAFLFHFATYAEWPAERAGEPITFAVLRATDIAENLERFARGRNLQGRPIVVRRIRSLTELDGAQMLFIGASENRRLVQLIRAVDGPTLVVTDAPDGLPDGAMINFQQVNRRVRFEIALPAVERAGLNLSSRLLSAAMRVKMSRCDPQCRPRSREGYRFANGPAIRTPSRV